MILIEDPFDPRIAVYRNVRERDLVGRAGLFIAEGEVVLRHLIASRRFETVSILLAQKRFERLSELIRAANPDIPVYVAPQSVMDEIAGFPLHRGVLAVGRWASSLDPRAMLSGLPDNVVVLGLVGVANHDNMGGLFRNAAAFGVGAILLDSTSCDPLYRKAIRVSVGAALLVPYTRVDAGDDIVTMLEERGFDVIAMSPGGISRLRDLTVGPKAAVLMGAEGPGLSAEILARCRTVRIPMTAGFDSLNLATASGVVLHHLLDQRTDRWEGPLHI